MHTHVAGTLNVCRGIIIHVCSKLLEEYSCSYVCWVDELSPEVVVSWEGLLAELCVHKYKGNGEFERATLSNVVQCTCIERYYLAAHLSRFCFRSAHHHHHKAVLLNLVVTQRLCIIQDLPCKTKKPYRRERYTKFITTPSLGHKSTSTPMQHAIIYYQSMGRSKGLYSLLESLQKYIYTTRYTISYSTFQTSLESAVVRVHTCTCTL